MKIKKILLYIFIICSILLAVSLLGLIKFPWQQSFRVVFGSFYVLFLPGFIWSYVFFEKSKTAKDKNGREEASAEKPLDGIERILLSFALSIALSPLTLFFLNKIGVKINLINSFLVILGLIVMGLGIVFYKNNFYRKTEQKNTNGK